MLVGEVVMVIKQLQVRPADVLSLRVDPLTITGPWYGRIQNPRRKGGVPIDEPDIFNSFEDKDEGDHNREDLLGESGEETNEIAGIGGNDDHTKNSNPDSNPEPELKIRVSVPLRN